MMVFKFKFQSYFDLQTRTESMQVIQWAVGGAEVVQRTRHLFGAYKWFKLGKISVKFVPISTLPVDPQGLSYDADDPQTVDPRDQANLGLVRITNGEDIFTDMSKLSADQQKRVYDSMMLDPRWSKFMLQSGFRRTAYPLYWQVGQLAQDKYPGATINIPYFADGGTYPNAIGNTIMDRIVYQNGPKTSTEIGSSARGLFQTGRKGRLGFLPTDYYQQLANSTGVKSDEAGINNVPEVSVITAVLPKAFKTTYYYRVYVTEEVLFKGVRSSPPIYDVSGNFICNNGLDNFIYGSINFDAPPYVDQNVSAAPLMNRNMNNGEKMP